MRYNGLIEASTFKNGLNSREHFFVVVASEPEGRYDDMKSKKLSIRDGFM